VPLSDVFWSILLISLFFAWLMLLFRVFADLLRSQDLGGLSKAAWALIVILFPLLGVLVYVAVRGTGMSERDVADAYRVAGAGPDPMAASRAASARANIRTQGL
jgi:hypothetical protein